MRNWICCILFISSIVPAFSQQVPYSDATALALSGTDLCYSGAWYGIRNPSLLALHQVSSVGINYHNRYLIPGLGSQSVYGSFPFHGWWGCSVNYFGTKALNESSFSVSYGRKIFQWLDAGITINGHRLAVEALPEESFSITGDIGLVVKPVEGVLTGIHLINPNRSGYANSGQDYLPAELNIGLAWSEAGDFYLAAQLHWQDYSDLYLSLGAECRIGKFLALRAGLKTGSVTSYSYGLAFGFKKITFSVGFEQHTCLGMSSAVTLNYKFSSHESQD